ncbi:hypothetical protein J5N97_020949 [Dioscorea zingiberensis]|uniref:DUF155 domain-containing protein n=1 Tax=Dioscorea zingiberensis TaxID=325984 RepID=A0A9D5HE47_9LILI|nr:hypothetical protein J5N97_020949 [Dioscorea zingiberensis]
MPLCLPAAAPPSFPLLPASSRGSANPQVPVLGEAEAAEPIDLESLQAENSFNVITPDSHANNFAIYTNNDPHYGSIVLFNVPNHKVDVYLKTVEKHASDLLPEIKNDDYVVVEKPNLETWVQGGLDSIMLRKLSIDGIGTIGSVLGQNIALDYHIRQVKQIIMELEDINCQIVNGGFFSRKRKSLCELVSDVNSELDFFNHNLEILKRSNIANDAQVWECLSTGFGLTKMISTLDLDLKQAMVRTLKLKLILTERESLLKDVGEVLFYGSLLWDTLKDNYGLVIDLKTLQAQNFAFIMPNSHSTNFAIYTKDMPHALEVGFGKRKKSNCQYMVVFQYGSIVLFNIPDHEAYFYLRMVEKYASGLLPEIKKDDYVVVEKPTLETWVHCGLDSIMLKNLSMDGIGTIGSVLGQSIALDYHIRQVKQIITKLEDFNCLLAKGGTFSWQTIDLFQPVSYACSKLDFVNHKLEILKMSNITNDTKIWECLSSEFDLTKIISTLELDLQQAMVTTLKLKIILTQRQSLVVDVIIFSTIMLIILRWLSVSRSDQMTHPFQLND